MFLNPLMLLGLSAVTVPVIVHLLNRRKFDRVVWAAMRFLQVSIQQNQRRIKVEDILLLIVRCLLVALLAVVLARPVIKSGAAAGLFSQSGLTAVVVIDNSMSMGLGDGVTSRFDLARRAAEEVVGGLPGGSSAALLLASDTVESVIPEPATDLPYVRKTLKDLKLCDRGTDLLPAIRQGIDILQRHMGLKKEIYLITDAQQSAWRQLDEIKRLLESHRDDIRLRLVLVGQKEERNLCVSDIHLSSGLPVVGQPLGVQVQVSNFGKSEARDVRVSLQIDSEPAGDESTIDSLPPGTSRGVVLFAKLRTEGMHSLTASIPADRLPADDSRSMVLRAWSGVRVLLVDGDPGREGRDSEIFYLRNILAPLTAAEADQHFIRVSSIPATDLPTANLENVDVLIFANVPDWPAAVTDRLASHVRHGGGLMLFPGANTSIDHHNHELFDRFAMLPARLGPAHGDPAKQEIFFHLAEKITDHPIASIWSDPAAGNPATAHFYRAFTLIPPSPTTRPAPGDAGEGHAILRFSDNTPAVMERSFGQGRTVLFSSTADTAWNDLPVHPGIFVPLIHRTIESIVQRQDESMNLRVGDTFTWTLGPELLGKDASILKPGAAGATRDARKIELIGNNPALRYGATDLAGIYRINIEGDATRTLVAARTDAEESNLEDLTESQLQSMADLMHPVRWPGESLSTFMQKERIGTEMWLPLAMLALILAVGEMLLAYRFSQPK